MAAAAAASLGLPECLALLARQRVKEVVVEQVPRRWKVRCQWARSVSAMVAGSVCTMPAPLVTACNEAERPGARR